MMVIRDMLSRMEAEHKTKLEQLHVMQEQQRCLSITTIMIIIFFFLWVSPASVFSLCLITNEYMVGILFENTKEIRSVAAGSVSGIITQQTSAFIDCAFF